MKITFRKATRGDSAVAMQLVDRALRDYGLYAVPEAGDIDLTDLEQHYDARGGCFELIEAGGEVVGVVGWRPAGDGVMELKKLYLASSARGHGLGRRAAERMIAAARAAGARAIVLETATRLTEANALYRRLGFVPVQGAAAASFATLTDQCDLAYRLELV
ncbi:MAG TPA: GNAT family N-acetyltransferase [Kofleriaceae bacterium]